MQGKPGSSVHISHGMPDIEALMQQWPPEVEQQLHNLRLPDATLVRPLFTCHTVSRLRQSTQHVAVGIA